MFYTFQKATVIASLMLSMSSLQATDWPSLNHDLENTSSNDAETTLNPSNVSQLALLWSAPGAQVNVAPVVVNDVVYYGDTAGNIFGKNVNDGSDVYGPVNIGASIDGPVAIFGDTLYATSAELKLFAFNLDLTPKIAFNGGFVIINPTAVGKAQVYAGPVVVDNIVIIPITSNAFEIYYSFYPSLRGGVNAFDATTGDFLWRTPIIALNEGTAGGAWSTPSVDQNLKRIYLGTTNATSPPAGNNTAALLSLNYLTGEIVWSNQYTKDAVWGLLYPCGLDFDVGASPNLFISKDKNVVGVGSKAGVYRVWERDSGKNVWDVAMIPNDTKPSINGNPSAAYANKKIYTIANYDTSGLPENVINILANAGNPTVQGQGFGELFLSFSTYDYTTIRSICARHGRIKWTNILIGTTFASITHANGVLYTGNFNGIIRALDASNGNELFSTSIGLPITAPITVVDGKVFVPVGLLGPGFMNVYSLPSPTR